MPRPRALTPRFFRSAAALRRWLAERHADAAELWVGFHKRSSGREGLGYQAAVDEAFCYGWIGGVRKSIDEASYAIRFTRRKPGSAWSAVDLRRADDLIAAGRMRLSGRAAWDRRDEKRARRPSVERPEPALAAADEKRLRADRAAWRFFQAQAPSYRRAAGFWVASAKRAATRARRLAALITCSARGERLPHLAGT